MSLPQTDKPLPIALPLELTEPKKEHSATPHLAETARIPAQAPRERPACFADIARHQPELASRDGDYEPRHLRR